MKKFVSSLASLMLLSSALMADQSGESAKKPAEQSSAIKIGVINFKQIVEESKYGKLEQGNFETLKKQMESILEEKEKSLNEFSAKFNDPDYVDSLSHEAENELKHKFRVINQEVGQLQAQYYQTLQQANMKILQKLNEIVSKAAETVAKDNQLDLILNEDSGFYYAPTLDISKKVITALDAQFDKEKSTKSSL